MDDRVAVAGRDRHHRVRHPCAVPRAHENGQIAARSNFHGRSAMAIERKYVGPRLSQMVIHGDTIYLAGIVAEHPVPDVAGQTGQILDKIDQYLKEAGSDKSKMLSATIWLSDIRYYDEM